MREVAPAPARRRRDGRRGDRRPAARRPARRRRRGARPPRRAALAAARNAGVSTALDAGADLVVLLDVDCLPGPGLLEGYERAAAQVPDDLLCGPVTYLPEGSCPSGPTSSPSTPGRTRPVRHPAGELVRDGDHDLFWSLSFAVTPSTWRALGGFCEEYVGYGGEDTDLAWTARDRGVGLTWVGGAQAYHQWHPSPRRRSSTSSTSCATPVWRTGGGPLADAGMVGRARGARARALGGRRTGGCGESVPGPTIGS